MNTFHGSVAELLLDPGAHLVGLSGVARVKSTNFNELLIN